MVMLMSKLVFSFEQCQARHVDFLLSMFYSGHVMDMVVIYLWHNSICGNLSGCYLSDCYSHVPKFNPNSAKMLSKFSQNAVQIHPKCS